MQGIPRSALIADDAQPLLPLLVDLRLEARLIQLGIRIVRLSAIGGIAPRIDGIRLNRGCIFCHLGVGRPLKSCRPLIRIGGQRAHRYRKYQEKQYRQHALGKTICRQGMRFGFPHALDLLHLPPEWEQQGLGGWTETGSRRPNF